MGSARKRRLAAAELGRAAELVMVLAAAGQARGGRAPTAAERALAAEARERLAEAVTAAALVRPKELFPREAVRALVVDLGLSRARDPAAMGYRPHRSSIADRIALTKRKMKEGKQVTVHSSNNVPQTTALGATTIFQHDACNSTPASSRNLSSVVSFPATTTVYMSSPDMLRQTRINEAPTGASSVKSANTPSIAVPPTIKVEKGVNGPNFTQSGETIGQPNKSAHSSVISQTGKYQDKRTPVIQLATQNTVMGHEAPQGASIPQRSIFHKAIARNVQQILHHPADHPNWTIPSTEYMHARLDCQICKVSIAGVDSLLVCDACERGVHIKCLAPYGNKGLPEAEWYCLTCIAHSRGRPLPPKYGKVTRTVVVPKATDVTLQSQSENLTTKG